MLINDRDWFVLAGLPVSIFLLNFNYLKGKNFIKNYALFEKETKESLTDLIECIFIELPKFIHTAKGNAL